MAWSKNNQAQVTAWITLVDLNQLAKAFKESKDVKMEELAFWGHAASDDMRKLILEGLSIQIDNLYTKFHGARYEDTSNRDTALSSMRDILKDSTKTVEDFAQVCDDHYKFWKEGE